MAYKLVMVSEEYGREEFDYPTRQEAEAGQERIEAKARKLRDGSHLDEDDEKEEEL
jgi:hypothetical protein